MSLNSETESFFVGKNVLIDKGDVLMNVEIWIKLKQKNTD